jgi:hypothetical protein
LILVSRIVFIIRQSATLDWRQQANALIECLRRGRVISPDKRASRQLTIADEKPIYGSDASRAFCVKASLFAGCLHQCIRGAEKQ